MSAPKSAEVIAAWIADKISDELQLAPDEIDPDAPFSSYGISSSTAVIISGDLMEWLEVELPPTLLYEYPSIVALAPHLAWRLSPSGAGEKTVECERHASTDREAIAIVGIGCRFPGANGPAAFWDLLRNGVDAVGEVPRDRWDFYRSTHRGGFTSGIDLFDAPFFGISPREAVLMDPQQRLILETAWEALEDAGIGPKSLAGTRTGVFLGISVNDYSELLRRDADFSDPYAATGNALSIAANRLSYLLDLHGPSLAVDTACSSALVAIHLACQSMRNGESGMAIVGGVNAILTSSVTVNFNRAGMLSPDGRCMAFDKRANGYVRGEGAGVIVLKPLALALKDRDPIYAVIHGSAVNQDGRSNGLTAPSRLAQEEVLRQALAEAQVSPAEIQYVEAHGTGTALGDPIEVQALGSVLAVGRAPGQHCAIGSVKTNIGHLEAAAGIAGTIKVALSLFHQEIPPSLHFETANPHIPFSDLPVSVQKSLGPWPVPTTRALAGVSSFGFGGTNAHVVLGSAPKAADVPRSRAGLGLFVLSAQSAKALQTLAERCRDQFASTDADPPSLNDICYTAGVRRSHYDHRLALAADSTRALIAALDGFARSTPLAGTSSGFVRSAHKHSLAFVFSSDAAFPAQCCSELLQTEPVFRKTFREHQSSGPNCAFQIAIAALWRSWGIVPNAVVGPGAGEVSFEEAMRSGIRTFIEMGPHPASREEWGRRTLLERLGSLYTLGHDVSWTEVWGAEGRFVRFPRYPWQHRRYWLKDAGGDFFPTHGSTRSWRRIEQPAHLPGTTIWESEVEAGPVSLAEYIGMAEMAARQAIGENSFRISDLVTHETAARSGDDTHKLQCVLSPGSANEHVFQVYGRTGQAPWELRAAARIDRFSRASKASIQKGIDFSLMFFAAGGGSLEVHKYKHVLEAARFADRFGFASISVPERHFTGFGSLYPNPSVLHAAIARETQNVRLRAGSVVLPLHNPIRVAEEWAMVDNLSGGRVELSFASGWHPNDFVLAPEAYADRHGEMIRGIELVQRLWRGESFTGRNGAGEQVNVSTFPRPLQKEVPVWVTAAGNPATFAMAGEIGANLLTHLLDQDVATLAAKLALYRESRQKHGHDPETGRVSVMLHTFIGTDLETVREQVRKPYSDYLNSIYSLLKGLSTSRGREVNPDTLPQSEREEFIAMIFDRFFSSRSLLGTKESCRGIVEELRGIGVDDIACLLDFGVDTDLTLAHLPYLAEFLEEVKAKGAGTTASSTVREARGSGPLSTEALDQCFLALTAAAGRQDNGNVSEGAWTPVAMQEFIWHGPGEALGHCRSEVTSRAHDKGDLRMIDEQGNVVAEARGVKLKRLSAGGPSPLPDRLNGLFYDLKWQPMEDPPGEPDTTPGPGTWILLADRGGAGQSLAEYLNQKGERCVLRFQDELGSAQQVGEILKSFIDGHATPVRGVVHLSSLDAPIPENATAASVENGQALGAESVLHVIQALANLDTARAPRLWLVTRGAQATGNAAAPVSVGQSTIWGFGRTCSIEHPEIWGGLIDLDPETDSIGDLGRIVLGGSVEDQIALRHGRILVARLARTKPFPMETGTALRADGSYLITGGLDGVGFEVANWLVLRGAKHLVLAGRKRLPPRETWDAAAADTFWAPYIAKLTALESLGASVEYFAVDVADDREMAALFSMLRSSGRPPIRGVLHAASVWAAEDGSSLVRALTHLDTGAVRRVFRPKVTGAWLLQHEMRDQPYDFMVFFSSAASVCGSPGQGNYAAAGAFQDGLAHWLRSQGKPGISINWGPISGVGFGASGAGLRVHQYWEAQGINRIGVSEVLEALDRILSAGVTQATVMNLNWDVMGSAFPQVSRMPWARGMFGKSSVDRDAGGRPVFANLASLAASERQLVLQDYLRTTIGTSLRQPLAEIGTDQAITNLGLDSLIALELRNKIETETGVQVPIVKLLQGPTIAQLADYVCEQMGRPLPRAIPPAPQSDARAQVDKLSDDEVGVLLNEMLAAQENAR